VDKQTERKGSAFTELLSIFLHLDHKFPILEASAFLLFLCALLFSSISSLDPQSAFNYMAGLGGLSLSSLILLILILKNASSGWGGEFEKGTMQTFLIYPLSRGRVLLARLTSSVLLPLGLVVLSRFSVVYIISPVFTESQFPSLVLGFLCSLTIPIMVAAIVVLAIQWAKSGGVPFAIGLVGYFAMLIFSLFLVAIGSNTGHPELVWVAFFLNPASAFSSYYSRLSGQFYCSPCPPVPTYTQAVELLASNLLLSVCLLVLSAMLFVKRTEV
jgi:ABC-type transport system involved in multi-copper enzyme maturation permease subunit